MHALARACWEALQIDAPLPPCSDGDGRVPLRSLRVCDRRAASVRRYPGLRHSELIHSGEVQADIIAALLDLEQGEATAAARAA